jgi:hypothetical protein
MKTDIPETFPIQREALGVYCCLKETVEPSVEDKEISKFLGEMVMAYGFSLLHCVERSCEKVELLEAKIEELEAKIEELEELEADHADVVRIHVHKFPLENASGLPPQTTASDD